MKKRKICVFLGNSANYSSLKPIMREIQKSPKLELILFVGASALLDKFGEVVKLVERDGFHIHERIYSIVEGENLVTMAKSAGLGLIELPTLFNEYKPDFTLILADRFEMLAAAVASDYMNIPVIHVLGGEFSGSVDEMIRHAITKLAHVHFAPTEQARQIILQMGEDEHCVFNVGCPRMDTVKEFLSQPHNLARADRINEYIRTTGVGSIFDVNDRFLLVLQHPVTTEFGQGEFQINQTLEAVHQVSNEHNLNVIMMWPNPDAGSAHIAKGIRMFREQGKDKHFHFFKHFPFEDWIWLMNKTSCMIGNSSSGVRESCFIGTPVVNVGTRQNNRLRGKNVIDVGYDVKEIIKAIERQMEHEKYPSENLYGHGNAGARIAKILETIEVDIQKKFFVRKVISD